MTPQPLDRKGLAVAAGTFALWGVVPVYWNLLKVVPALHIVMHRIVWSALLVVGWLLLREGWRWLDAVRAQPRAMAILALTSVLIAGNWGIYIWAVNNGHVIETSLGYFINPLINVALGVLVLRERLTRLQWVAVACAAAGVAWLTWSAGTPPWISLSLAISFALYGLLRKLAPVDAVAGLGVESLYLFLPALLFVLWGEFGHGGGFVDGWGWRVDLLLVFGGVITAAPLIGFAYGVRRIPFSLVGLLQYIAPTLQLLLGVFFYKEAFGPERAVGFAIIWAGLLLYAGEGLWRAQRRRRRPT